MTSSAIASRYASALVDVVTAPGSKLDPATALRDLRTFEDIVNGSAELRNALTSPAVSLSRKRAVIDRLVTALGVSRVIRNFLLVLSDHRRSGAITEMAGVFEVLLDERLGVVRADVASARELSDGERAGLSDKLAQVTGKKMRMHFAVDPDLIGGVVARVGSSVYDGSVRGQLTALGRKLAAN